MIGKSHPFADKEHRRGRIALKEYLAFPHVGVTFPNSQPSAIDKALSDREIGLVTPSFTANIATMHGRDLNMSLPSRLAHALESDWFVEFKLPFDLRRTTYYLVWHKRTNVDPAINWFRGVISKMGPIRDIDKASTSSKPLIGTAS